MLDLEFVERTDVGRVRDLQRRCTWAFRGAGNLRAGAYMHGWMRSCWRTAWGPGKGEVASRTAGESMVAGFHNAKDGESHSAVLQRLVQQANTRVFESAVTGGRTSAGMATTIVACALRYDRVCVAHVGDSRCYLIRSGKAAPITLGTTIAPASKCRRLHRCARSGRGRDWSYPSSAAPSEPNWSQMSMPATTKFSPAMFSCCARTACTGRW